MKTKLLISTAILSFATVANVMAEDFVVNNGDTINETSGTEKYYDSIIINGGTVNIKNGSEIKTENTGDVISISGGNISLDEGEIKGHNGNMNISGGTINLTNDSEIWAGTMTISGSAVVNVTDSEFSGDKTLNINGGTINLNNSYMIPDEGAEENPSLFKMTDGTLNLNNSAIGSQLDSETEVFNAGPAVLSGGVINVLTGNNTFLMKNVEVQNTVNIAKGTTLSVYESYDDNSEAFINKGTLNFINGGKFALSGNGTLNGNLNVNNNGVVDLGTNKLTVDGNIAFNDGSKLALIFTSKDKVGQIDAKNITISENNTTLDMSFNNAVVANEGVDVKVLNASEQLSGAFAKIAENSEYNVKAKGNGVYNISKKSSGGDDDVQPAKSDAGEAWNDLDTGSIDNQTTIAVAERLTYLRNHQTTSEGKKAYESALTALAPETAPAVQQAATEGANQIFSAVGTRLSGGSVASSKQGLSSGDNPFTKVAVWVQGLFNKAKLDDTKASKGFDSKTYGTAMGIESKLNEEIKLGLGYAYSKTDIDGFMRDTDAKTHTAIVYGEYKPSDWYVNMVASYGWSKYNEKKNVAGVGVKADWDVESFAVQTMTGYEMNVNEVAFTPEAGLRYIHIKQDGYKDTADQRVSGNNSDILTGVLGTKVAKSWALENGMLITPEIKAAMTYDMKNDKGGSVVTLANGSTYAVSGKALDRFGIELGAGITMEVNDNVELSLGYEGKFREDYQDHTGLVNAKYKF